MCKIKEGGEDGESRRTVNPFPLGEWVQIPPLLPNIYPGVAQLIERVVWDHEAAGLSPVTWTILS